MQMYVHQKQVLFLRCFHKITELPLVLAIPLHSVNFITAPLPTDPKAQSHYLRMSQNLEGLGLQAEFLQWDSGKGFVVVG